MITRSALATIAAAVFLAACSAPPSQLPTDSAGPRASASSDLGGSASPGASSAEVGWTQLATAGPAPAPREDHTWTVTPDGAIAYLFGGRDGGEIFDDLWAYDLDANSWSRIAATGPKPRFGHNAAWVPGIGLVIFAGQGPGGFFNDLWAFDPASDEWRELPASGATPVSRYGSCAAIGPDARLWISHGFTSEGQRFADTRAYDFETATWTDETPVGNAPIQRCLHACWWTDDDALVLYAGQTTGVTALGDLWHLGIGERPGTNGWSELPADGLPAARNLYASARWSSGTLVFGGQGLDGDYLADSWWISDAGPVVPVDLGEAAPAPRSGSELIADPARGRLLLFGGRNGDGAFADLWQVAIPARP
jgi:hypothetical protein